jgi:hypothetical protein
MGSLSADPLKPSLRSATRTEKEMTLLGKEGILKSVLTRAADVCEYLYKGLDNVYSAADKEMIENIPSVLDLERLIRELKLHHSAYIAAQHTLEFIKAAKFIDHNLEVKYEVPELRFQYQVFVRQLAAIAESDGSEKLSSLDILVKFMNTEAKLYDGCQAVVDVMLQAAVKKSVESVVESWISVLEHHCSKSRPLSSDTIQTEMMIAVNGPDVPHCDSVVEETMLEYWRRMKPGTLQDGHFVRRSDRIKSYFISKAVDKIVLQPPKTKFMV